MIPHDVTIMTCVKFGHHFDGWCILSPVLCTNLDRIAVKFFTFLNNFVRK